MHIYFRKLLNAKRDLEQTNQRKKIQMKNDRF